MTIKDYAGIINKRLEQLLPERFENEKPEGNTVPWLLGNSMRYSAVAGGKRLRGALLMAAAKMLGGDEKEALEYACALEMIHTYSLIHDDLPGMDNDTLRRGRPTNHVVFGEGQAILAGDGLLSYAAEHMCDTALTSEKNAGGGLLAMKCILKGAGISGMVAGQVIDLYSEREKLSDEGLLDYIQLNKTAAMIVSPCKAGCALAGYKEDSPEMQAMAAYGENLGKCFQTVDDILDVISDPATLGKSIGKDAEEGKLTAMSLYGLDGAREKAKQYTEQAVSALSIFGEKAKFFTELAEEMLTRVS